MKKQSSEVGEESKINKEVRSEQPWQGKGRRTPVSLNQGQMLIYREIIEAELQSPFLLWISSRLCVTFLFVVLYFFLKEGFQIIWASNSTKPASVPCGDKSLPGRERAHRHAGFFICFYHASCHLSLKRNVSQVNTEWPDRQCPQLPISSK